MLDLKNADGDLWHLEAGPLGIQLSVLPSKPLLDDGHHDYCTLALRFSTATKLLEVLETGGVFESPQGEVRVDNGATMRFSAPHFHGRVLVSSISAEATRALAGAIRAALAGELRLRREPRPPQGRNAPCACGSRRKYKECCRRYRVRAEKELQPLRSLEEAIVADLVDQGLSESRAVLDPNYWELLGRAAGTSGYAKEAVLCFSKALSLDPAHVNARLNLAAALSQGGDFQAALRILERLPSKVERRDAILGDVYLASGDHQSAIDAYSRAIEQEPDFDHVYVQLLAALEHIESPNYEFWVRRAIAACPASAQVAHAFSYFLLRSSRLTELVDATWIETLEAEPWREDIVGRRKSDPHLIVEAQLFRSAAIVEARDDIEELRRAIATLRSAPEAWHLCDPAKLLIRAAAKYGQPTLASEAWQKICPKCQELGRGLLGSVHTYQALAHLNAKEHEQSVQCARTALSARPDDRYALHCLWWASDELGEYQVALEGADKLRACAPDWPCISYNMGLIAEGIGGWGSAQAYYQDELTKDPTNWMAAENLAVVHLFRGDLAQAEACWDRARGLWAADRLDSEEADADANHASALREKQRSWESLLREARRLTGAELYARALEDLRNALPAPPGGRVRVPARLIPFDELVAALRAGREPTSRDAADQLDALNVRRDYSIIARSLDESIPGWEQLPPPARRALLEAERAWHESNAQDCSMHVVAYAKTVEISLKQLVFDEFRAVVQSRADFGESVRAVVEDPKGQARRFGQFLERGEHLELGGMGHALRLAAGKSARRLALLGWFKAHVETAFGAAVLAAAYCDECKVLSDLRNPAAHAETFGRDTLVRARAAAQALLTPLIAGQVPDASSQAGAASHNE